MDDVVLTPQTVIARWANDVLVVHASGHEGGVANVGIAAQPDDDGGPPLFEVRGRMAPFAGLFPYGVTSIFELPSRPDEILLVTRDGNERVAVT